MICSGNAQIESLHGRTAVTSGGGDMVLFQPAPSVEMLSRSSVIQ